ncbi:MAG: hypothetical protein ACM3ZQ_10375 [Bacillota bacterium]
MNERLRKSITWGSIGLYAVAELIMGEKMVYPGLIALGAVAIALSVIYSTSNKVSSKRLLAEIVLDVIMLGVMGLSAFRMMNGV